MGEDKHYIYHNLREPFYGASNLSRDMKKKIIENVGYAGPFLRYELEERRLKEEFKNSRVSTYPDDYEPSSSVKLRLTGRRFFTFDNVGGPLEIIFSDGTVKPVTSNCIELPEPYYPCDSEAWQSWKRITGHPDICIKKIYTFDTGIVVLEYLWADCHIYTMKAYKDGLEFARLKSSENCDAGREFFDEMMHSNDPEPLITKMKQMYRWDWPDNRE